MGSQREYNVKEIVYAKETIEFVTVAVEYCIFLEKFQEISPGEFAGKALKVLPLLYLKAQLVPPVEDDNLGLIGNVVGEEDYNYILDRVTNVIGKYNDYLEVFVDDMQYSDEPILAHIAENLADIYQDLRNFVAIYERGLEEHMNEALYVCMDNFRHYWGQTLVNVLRALHSIKYPSGSNSFTEDDLFDNDDEQW